MQLSAFQFTCCLLTDDVSTSAYILSKTWIMNWKGV